MTEESLRNILTTLFSILSLCRQNSVDEGKPIETVDKAAMDELQELINRTAGNRKFLLESDWKYLTRRVLERGLEHLE